MTTTSRRSPRLSEHGKPRAVERSCALPPRPSASDRRKQPGINNEVMIRFGRKASFTSLDVPSLRHWFSTMRRNRNLLSLVFLLCAPLALSARGASNPPTPQNAPAAPGGSSSAAPPLQLSHAWIVVKTGAPERKALEAAGFRIAPAVNRHNGQGTASVTVELLNGFLELIYPDPTVPVSPNLQAGPKSSA